MQAQAGHIAEQIDKSATAEKSAVVALYDTHLEAEQAVVIGLEEKAREFRDSGLEIYVGAADGGGSK